MCQPMVPSDQVCDTLGHRASVLVGFILEEQQSFFSLVSVCKKLVTNDSRHNRPGLVTSCSLHHEPSPNPPHGAAAIGSARIHHMMYTACYRCSVVQPVLSGRLLLPEVGSVPSQRGQLCVAIRQRLCELCDARLLPVQRPLDLLPGHLFLHAAWCLNGGLRSNPFAPLHTTYLVRVWFH